MRSALGWLAIAWVILVGIVGFAQTPSGGFAGGSNAQARFLVQPTSTSPIVESIYVCNTTQAGWVAGNDTTGDGLTQLTPYLTVQRALRDIPNLYTVFVLIRLCPGTYTDTSAQLSVVPAPPFPGAGNANTQIHGPSVAQETWTSVGAGALTSGKYSRVQSTVASFATAVVDGAQWLELTPITGTIANVPQGFQPLSESSGTTLHYVVTSTSALSGVVSASVPLHLSAYQVVFSGGLTARGPVSDPASTTAPQATLRFVGVKFTGSVQMLNVQTQGVSFAGAVTTSSSNINNSSFSSTVTVTNNRFSNSLFKDGSTRVFGISNTFVGSVFRGTVGVDSYKLTLGSQPSNNRNNAAIFSFSAVDFENTGNGIFLGGTGSDLTVTAPCSSTVTGSLMLITAGALLQCTGVAGGKFTGTQGAAMVVTNGGRMNCADVLTGNLANSSVAGEDVIFGSASAVTFASLTDSFMAVNPVRDFTTVVPGSLGGAVTGTCTLAGALPSSCSVGSLSTALTQCACNTAVGCVVTVPLNATISAGTLTVQTAAAATSACVVGCVCGK